MTFSRAPRQLHVFPSSFDWSIGLSVSFVINQGDYTGFAFTPLHRNCSNLPFNCKKKKHPEGKIPGCLILIIKRKEWLFFLCSLADLHNQSITHFHLFFYRILVYVY